MDAGIGHYNWTLGALGADCVATCAATPSCDTGLVHAPAACDVGGFDLIDSAMAVQHAAYVAGDVLFACADDVKRWEYAFVPAVCTHAECCVASLGDPPCVGTCAINLEDPANRAVVTCDESDIHYQRLCPCSCALPPAPP